MFLMVPGFVLVDEGCVVDVMRVVVEGPADL